MPRTTRPASGGGWSLATDVIDDLQQDVIVAQSNTEPSEDSQFCTYSGSSPCVILSDNIPSKLKAQGQPRMTNHSKRRLDYKAFDTILKRRGLWRNPIYLQRKEALRCYIEDVREVMAMCVVEIQTGCNTVVTMVMTYCNIRYHQ